MKKKKEKRDDEHQWHKKQGGHNGDRLKNKSVREGQKLSLFQKAKRKGKEKKDRVKRQ